MYVGAGLRCTGVDVRVRVRDLRTSCVRVCVGERDERAGQRVGHRPPHIRASVHIFSQCGTTTGSLLGYEHRATYRAKLHSEKSSSIGHNRQQ